METEQKHSFERFLKGFLEEGKAYLEREPKFCEEISKMFWDEKIFLDMVNAFEASCTLVDDRQAVKLVIMELYENVGLPHHPGVDAEQQNAFFQLLGKLPNAKAAMIARSDEDEYTPKDLTDKIQSQTVEGIQHAWPELVVDAFSVEVETK
jgi:hypothetical protein